jgi:hypothetical protein
MIIYIDESGSFVAADAPGKWNAVVAVAVPESANAGVERALSTLKQRSAVSDSAEAKLNVHAESDYLRFLSDLATEEIVVFCIATDAGRNDLNATADHQTRQVDGVLRHIDKMRHAGGRAALEKMAGDLRSLSPQLYVQLTCQIDLMYDVVCRSILYFAQRDSSALSNFIWRIDRKDINPTLFEQSFERLSTLLLQARSIDEPMPMVTGFDYGAMAKYRFEEGKLPEYLSKEYGINAKHGLNIQKIVRDDIAFVDSAISAGIQVADLIASGLRKCLRDQFDDTEAVSAALGNIMVEAERDRLPINLVGFVERIPLPTRTARIVRIMSTRAKPMLRRPFVYGGKGPIEF